MIQRLKAFLFWIADISKPAGLAGHTPVAVGGTANSNPDAWGPSKEWSKKANGSWSDPSFDSTLPAVHGPNAMELSRQVCH
jgi:hypothetical protein